MSPEMLSLIGILCGLATLIIIAYRGVVVLLVAPIAAVVVIVFAGLPIIETLTGPFMTSYASFAKNNYLIFFCSAILGKMLGDSGAARGIGHAVADWIMKVPGGHERFLAVCAVTVINAILSLGGIGSYVLVFTMLPITKNLFERLDVPWHMFVCSSFGSGTITLTMLPGSPAITNLVPTTYLGTTAMAAPTLGLIATVITIFMGLAYFEFIIKKADREHEGFLPTGARISASYQEVVTKPPQPFLKSIFPTAVLLVVMNVFGQSPITAMLAAMAAVYILFRREFSSIKKTVSEGAGNGVAALASICSVVAFAGVVSSTPGYKLVVASLDKVPGPPIFQLVVAANVIAAITGSATGGLGITMEQLSGKFLSMGMNPEVIHRIGAMSASCFDSLPHNGSINNTLTVVHLTHKEAFKHYWWTCNVIPFITTIIVAVIAQYGVV